MSRAQQFADALQQLEQDRDLDAFLERFADDVRLFRPEAGGQESGVEGARRFWQAYLDQFEEIGSTFDRVVDADALGELEWVGAGRLRSGRPVSYAGVSLLEHDDAGKVVRFATYYDTAAFTTPTAD
jgi:ketosteroid isomerase-like protein